VVTSAILMFAAWQLNPLSFYLSPFSLAILFFYSYTKRFTRWAHVVLGLAMGIAPAAAWIAVRRDFAKNFYDVIRRARRQIFFAVAFQRVARGGYHRRRQFGFRRQIGEKIIR
jgi:4-hydroxybenzoate polyprenyltransferase